jgi:hypothetical protein
MRAYAYTAAFNHKSEFQLSSHLGVTVADSFSAARTSPPPPTCQLQRGMFTLLSPSYFCFSVVEICAVSTLIHKHSLRHHHRRHRRHGRCSFTSLHFITTTARPAKLRKLRPSTVKNTKHYRNFTLCRTETSFTNIQSRSQPLAPSARHLITLKEHNPLVSCLTLPVSHPRHTSPSPFHSKTLLDARRTTRHRASRWEISCPRSRCDDLSSFVVHTLASRSADLFTAASSNRSCNQ